MISASDRQEILRLIDETLEIGGNLASACGALGIGESTYFRWKKQLKETGTLEDRRPTAELPEPANKLTTEEKAHVVEVLTSPEFADLPPSQIVPILAERGVYLCSVSAMYRILHENDMCKHRGSTKKPQKREIPTHIATGPNQVWSWDITYLNAEIKGEYYYLYLMMDIFSRYIVGWEVWEEQLAENSATLIKRAALSQNIAQNSVLVLHSDNGSPMKGSTMLATLERLGITPSFSRPRVSNDNPYSESLFKTLKFRPNFELDGFISLQAAREWCTTFVKWYNTMHRHSGIKFLTPHQRHYGEWEDIVQSRISTLEAAKAAHPERWKGRSIRNWLPEPEVYLNRVNVPPVSSSPDKATM